MIAEIWVAILSFEIILFISYTGMCYYIYNHQKLKHNENFSPSLSLIIPMFNESSVVEDKVKNIKGLDYPRDKIKVFFLDDHSTDDSAFKTQKCFEKYAVSGEVVHSEGAKGKVNAINWLLPMIQTEFVVLTDADTILEKDSIKYLLKPFVDPNTAAVGGKIVIISESENLSKSIESKYRAFYNICRVAESEIDSVSACSVLMAYRTEILRQIKIDPNTYADDNDAIYKIISKGYKVKYAQDAIVYERVPLSLKGRTLQKIRRMSGFMHILISNTNLFGKGKFGTIIYPFSFLIHVVSPYLVLFLILAYPILIYINYKYLLFLLVFAIPRVNNFILSFLITQLTATIAPFYGRKGSWTPIKDARYKVET